MISVRKLWTIVIITIALSFPLLAYADTYWIKEDNVKDKNCTEYFIFENENKIQLGFKVDGLTLISANQVKNDFKKEIKKKEHKTTDSSFKKNLDKFSSNMLKLSASLLCVFAILICIAVIDALILLFFLIRQAIIKKS